MFIPTATPIKPSTHHLNNPEFPLSLLCDTGLLHNMNLKNTRKIMHSARKKMSKYSSKFNFSQKLTTKFNKKIEIRLVFPFVTLSF